jgi:hypothetical protein
MALACGFLITLSGCCSFCEDGKLFPRLFRSNYSGPGLFQGGAECECNSTPVPPIMDSAAFPSPSWSPPRPNPSMPIPITNIPANQPPHLFKIPQAAPTPYAPTN